MNKKRDVILALCIIVMMISITVVSFRGGYEVGHEDAIDSLLDKRFEQTIYTVGGYVNQTMYNTTWNIGDGTSIEPTLTDDNFVVMMFLMFRYTSTEMVNRSPLVNVDFDFRFMFDYLNRTLERVYVGCWEGQRVDIFPSLINTTTVTFYGQATIVFFGYGQFDLIDVGVDLYGSETIKIRVK